MKNNKPFYQHMRKIKSAILVSFVLIMSTSNLLASTISVSVQNKALDLRSNQPYISASNSTMIPIRAVGEALGLIIDWQEPHITLSGRNTLTLKNTVARANSRTKALVINGTTYYQAIEIKNNRSYIKLRLLAEAFGYQVDWKNGKITVLIPKAIATPIDTHSIITFENKILELVNIERIKAGLSSLTMDEPLRIVARKKSEDLRVNRYFDHISPTYGSPFDMMTSFGISYTMAGENIAMGYQSPESVMQGWMNSPGHKANILKPEFTLIGIGYDASGHYWTQMFIRK
ncbi:stalk domain-containing protein [Cellulosilyticum sp. I15G10I2]|uniref:stalk domain-containing protein n=1 Tax=Cellulosilyticum sp. I15G10I2 TaxID=1892843 RepID=UPI00085BB2E3|nr:stalk domain-containing protein [Cellulosilyticum sp. I15G10I2]